ncbi:MAG: CC/Se motif family (seleno)protein [Desulfotomaculaceae bacterium]|nr:CC/Se motif family (seleno)protein [Desulfotomaculaceae bacterium]
MIKIEISKEARDYILSKNKAITVESVSMASCCGYSNEPLVFEYKPSTPEDYEEVIVDGIKVYVFKEGAVIAPGGARICLGDNNAPYKTLITEGLRYRDCFDNTHPGLYI